MRINDIETILAYMAVSGSEIQRVQTEHRLKLAECWGIEPGSRVLEIGCGQGDTTAVLAYAVGKEGFVHGIDNASPDYGSPFTLGQARANLVSSELGGRIQMDFEVDVMSPNVDFPSGSFDYVVLSHCSWYFGSQEEFAAVLTKVRKWAKRLCFAEWDPRITSVEQQAHLLAVLLQAQIGCFKDNSHSNVRTLFTPSDNVRIAEAAGWRVVKEEIFSSEAMQDGRWEIDIALSEQRRGYENIEAMPDKLKRLITSEYSLLEAALKSQKVKPLPIFAFVAE